MSPYPFAKVCLQGSLLFDLAAACIILQLDRTGGKPFQMEKPSRSRVYPAVTECYSVVRWSISVGSWYGGKYTATYAILSLSILSLLHPL